MLTSCVTAYIEEARDPRLSEIEWIVVEMAKNDGPLSLNPGSVWARISRRVFRLRVPCRLANETLETLRRFSVRAWYWNTIPQGDMHMLIDAGYSVAQAMEVLAHVAERRGFSPSVEECFA
jgi:hypothetical protein